MKTSIVKNQNAVKNLWIVLFVAIAFMACSESQDQTEQNEETTEVSVPEQSINEAVFMGNLAVVKQHIKAGTDLNEKDDFGSTPLSVAILFGKTDVALTLIDGGADLQETTADGSTPLHTAAFFCRVDIVKALLDKGVDKSVRNSFGSTALESVTPDFDEVKMIYDQMSRDLGPFGLKLDYEYLEATRPVIADMIENYQ